MKRIALVGNPNSGKSTLFNKLTGLFQKTGNYPGVTIDRTMGKLKLSDSEVAEIIDLPGAYSIHPTSFEEKIVTQILVDPSHVDHPDLVLYVLDIQDIDKQLLLLTQIIDMYIPTVLVLNKTDLKEKSLYSFDMANLSEKLNIDVIELNKNDKNWNQTLVGLISDNLQKELSANSFFNVENLLSKGRYSDHIKKDKGNTYQSYIQSMHKELFPLNSIVKKIDGKDKLELQVEETMGRYAILDSGQFYSKRNNLRSKAWHNRIDPLVTHPIFGPIIFLTIMFIVFQAIYYWASYPMDMIESLFTASSALIVPILGDHWWTSLITDGIIAGLAGVLVFVPQIAMLFFIIAALEDSGYMARIAYLMNGFMKRFGMSGRSMVTLISSGACAIPAIMSARTINSPREKLITILVAPFIGCSARLPIYIIMISFAIPQVMIWGIIDSRAFLFIALFILGGLLALITGFFLKFLFKNKESEDHFIIELPNYKIPDLKSILQTMWNKTKSFIVEAGKIIFLISIVLWFLASYGPKEKEIALNVAKEKIAKTNISKEEAQNILTSIALEESYIGQMGHFIEPAIRPLGYDWKIGIGLITSFAAREVFVGTMSTIYSLGGSEGEDLKQKMREQEFEDGTKVYGYATSLSLLIFYVIAMQCMSTLAVVKRETNSWTLPILQFLGMSILAYISAFIVYQLVSAFT